MNGFSESDITSVLDYWFGGVHPELNYKTKWFPTGSTDLQSKADTEVTDKFAPLLARTLTLDPEAYPCSERFLTAVIIVLDQFSRHIYRSLTPDNALRKKADALALRATGMLTSLASWDHNLSIAEFVFSLMPYRHASTVEHLNQVMTAIDDRYKKEEESLELLNKFKKQTVRRLQHLQDRAQADESSDILEHHEFEAGDCVDDMLKEPLVIATKAFLEQHAKCSEADFVISLSGGVDSMVIAKILAVLFPIVHGRKLVAMHIDYANREESGREAAFVKDWALRHGFEVHIRVVDEVTRGVTNRSDYEKISRQIRYGFYKDVLTEIGWEGAFSNVGVIFGHHVGDIQENVISNIMRGCSPLNLAGMAPVGVTEGVPIWRPLLGHTKKDILQFSHKYGVPYFKDTTPSWSTRGKLRNQLLPLLVDMYGIGCLNNITSLAAESDEAKELVHRSVYEPFLSSVRKFPTGLIVHVMAYKDQPISFWREMLKELMHSMSMSMVREKAVMNFVERLQREVPRTNIWLELRKGFNTFLDSNGDLLIFRDKVLQIEGGYRLSTKQGKDDSEIANSSLLPSVDAIRLEDGDNIALSIGETVQLDTWRVGCEIFDSTHSCYDGLVTEAKEAHILPTPRELLEGGKFSYLLPPLCVQDGRVLLKRHQSSSRPPIRVTALHGMDSKLRLGLPFLIPLPSAYAEEISRNVPATHIVRLTYSYIF